MNKSANQWPACFPGADVPPRCSKSWLGSRKQILSRPPWLHRMEGDFWNFTERGKICLGTAGSSLYPSAPFPDRNTQRRAKSLSLIAQSKPVAIPEPSGERARVESRGIWRGSEAFLPRPVRARPSPSNHTHGSRPPQKSQLNAIHTLSLSWGEKKKHFSARFPKQLRKDFKLRRSRREP